MIKMDRILYPVIKFERLFDRKRPPGELPPIQINGEDVEVRNSKLRTGDCFHFRLRKRLHSTIFLMMITWNFFILAA